MKSVSAAKFAARCNDYLEASRERPVLVTRNGKPVAVLLGVQDKAEAEQLAAGQPRTLRSVLQEGHEQIEAGRGIPHAQFWQEVAKSRRANRRAPSSGKSTTNV